MLKSKLSRIHDKFIELNFPVEYFISQSISTLFSDYFLTDLFLRLMDIIIFYAALKTNEDDKVKNSLLIIAGLYKISLCHSINLIRNERNENHSNKISRRIRRNPKG